MLLAARIANAGIFAHPCKPSVPANGALAIQLRHALGRPRSNSHRQGLQPLLRLAYNSFSAQARTTSASSFSFVASASSDATIGVRLGAPTRSKVPITSGEGPWRLRLAVPVRHGGRWLRTEVHRLWAAG